MGKRRFLCEIFLVIFFTIKKIEAAQEDLNNRGAWGGQADVEQGYFSRFAEKVGYGNPNPKGPDNAFDHDEGGSSAAVKVAHKAEQESSQQGVDGIAFQILGCCGNDL